VINRRSEQWWRAVERSTADRRADIHPLPQAGTEGPSKKKHETHFRRREASTARVVIATPCDHRRDYSRNLATGPTSGWTASGSSLFDHARTRVETRGPHCGERGHADKMVLSPPMPLAISDALPEETCYRSAEWTTCTSTTTSSPH